jgi:hypothetical protein
MLLYHPISIYSFILTQIYTDFKRYSMIIRKLFRRILLHIANFGVVEGEFDCASCFFGTLRSQKLAIKIIETLYF